MPDGYRIPDEKDEADAREPEPITLTYLALLEKLDNVSAEFRARDVATVTITREHWVSLGRPGGLDVRVRASDVA